MVAGLMTAICTLTPMREITKPRSALSPAGDGLVEEVSGGAVGCDGCGGVQPAAVVMSPMADFLCDEQCFHPYLRPAGLGCMVRGHEWGGEPFPCGGWPCEVVEVGGHGGPTGVGRVEGRMEEASVWWSVHGASLLDGGVDGWVRGAWGPAPCTGHGGLKGTVPGALLCVPLCASVAGFGVVAQMKMTLL